MNAERLNAVAHALRDELETLQLPELVGDLVNSLEQVVQQPQQAQHQQRVSQLREELRTRLASAASNEFSPAWRQHLDELDATELLGRPLAEAIERIFSQNEITPGAAVEDLTPIRDRLAVLHQALQKITDGMEELGIGREQLEPGAFEVGIMIPRGAVDNELGGLGQEFLDVKRILMPIVELATGSRPGLEVRTISSSDFTAYLAAVPAAAACLAHALDKIITIYKGILEVRALRQKLLEEDVPDERLDALREWVEERMETGLSELAEELRQEFSGDLDEGRSNELSNELRRSLRALANRIDRGYNLEVRYEPLPDGEGREEDARAEDGAAEYGALVQERLPNIQFINLSGATILALPEGNDHES